MTYRHQLKAILWRQWLLKKRTYVTTFVELLSPIVMISALVLAYNLVDPEHRPERIRVLETERTVNELQTGLADWLQASVSQECIDTWQNVTSPGIGYDPGHLERALPPSAVAGGSNLGSTLTDRQQLLPECMKNATSALGGLTQQLVKAAQGLIDRNGPFPLLTLDEFILLHEVLQAAVQTNPEALSLLRNVRSSFGRNLLGNLIDLGQVAFAPATPDVLRFAEHMSNSHELFEDYFYGVFHTEAEGETYALTAQPRLWALVVFHEGPNAQGSDYTIRMNFTTVPSASQKVNTHSHSVPRGYKRYITSGFLSLQSAIETYSLDLATSNEANIGPIPTDGQEPFMYTAWGSVFPTAAYNYNEFFNAVGPMLGLLMSLSLIYPLAMLVRGVVEEKETRARETMAIMGLDVRILALTWALTYWLVFAIIAASVTVICCASFFQSTSGTLLFVVLMLFTTSELAFGMMLASIFGNAKIAAITAPILHFSFLMPRYIFFRTEETQAIAGKVFCSFLSPSAFTFAADLFATYEGGGQGLGWSDVWVDAFPVGAIMIMLVWDTLLYSVLAWYLEAVLPGQYGPRLPLLFPLSASYWRHGYITGGLDISPREPAAALEEEEGGRLLNGAGQTAVDIHGLRKVYGDKIAVKGLSMSMREGEITALLGHNGAGKTSVVGMMTGLLRPTSGDCSIIGHSIVHHTAQARSFLGYCPQQNVLFGRLTVLEHMLVYSAIKGIPGGAFCPEALAAAEQMLEAVGLEDKRNAHAEALSGGMKRKLQVAIALLGNSKVILLDEPSSGVDPVSRRALWAILSKAKKDRAILLITHYTDEADVLSDQVAIMAEGELVSIGSALQLKEQFSNGYTLSMTLEVEGHVAPDSSRIVELVTSRVPGACCLRSAAAELVVRLPMDASASFADMLDELEANRAQLGLGHYAISSPTLEEAFLHANDVAHQPSGQPEQHAGTPAAQKGDSNHRDSQSGSSSCPGTPERDENGILSTAGTEDRWHSHKRPEQDVAIRGDGSVGPEVTSITNGHKAETTSTEPEWESVKIHKEDERLAVKIGASSMPRSTLERWRTALVEMLKKRAVSAVRDKKAILFALVLPVLAISLVMLILTINIDPSAPTMLLDLSVPGQSAPLSAFNLPRTLQACNGTGLRSPEDSLCRGTLAFWQRGDGDGMEMNKLLLEDITAGVKAQYGALVFDDPVLVRLAGPSGPPSNDTGRSRIGSTELQALLAAALPGALAGALPQDTLGAAFGGASGQAAVLSFLLSKEATVLRRMQARLRDHLPIHLMHNASSQHALPSLLSGLHETIGALNSAPGGARPRFVAHSHPLPLSLEESVELDSVLMVLTALFVLVPFCLLSGAFCINPVVERMSTAQHMQLLSGCPAAVYWAGSYIWDMATHLLVCFASLAIFAAFGDKATVGTPEQAFGCFLALSCYGLSVIPLAYCYSVGFGSPSAAQVAAAAVNFVLGFCAVNGSYVMALIPKTQALQRVLVHFFRIAPPFCLGEALIELTRYHFEKSIMEAAAHTEAIQAATAPASSLGNIASTLQGLGLTTPSPTAAPSGPSVGQAVAAFTPAGSVFAWNVLGRPLTLMLLEAAGLCALVLLIDIYSRTASLPWPLHRLPDGCFWLQAQGKACILWISRSGPGRLLNSTARHGGYAAVDQEESRRQFEMGHVAHQQFSTLAAPGNQQPSDPEEPPDIEIGQAINDSGRREDELVTAEWQRLENGLAAADTISLQHLRKVYPGNPPKVALHDLCLSIRAGERFGLLGANGAGKTTTLGILTRRILATSGDALVRGVSVLDSQPESRARLGYCPQVDPLLDLLTAREQLAMFARLKGVGRDQVDEAVAEVLRRVTIPEEMTFRPAGQYSGGNKRKLALGIALVGGVEAVLLDEPSSGMDPGSRRAMWKFITVATDGLADGSMQGVSTVMTTHSMEECEALCSRIGILHAGRLLCLGSPARLKSIYGSGLFLEIDASDAEEQHAAIAHFVGTELGGTVEERHLARAKFVLPTEVQSLAQVFRRLEAAKERLCISAYSLSMPTLEQVFLRVVGEQLQGDGP